MKASSRFAAPRVRIKPNFGRIAHQHSPRVHQRDAVATFPSFMKWVEMKIVTRSLRESSIKSSQNPSRATGSTPDVGSSRINISG